MSDDNTAAVAALAESASPRGNNNLADIMFDLSVNFLLYVVLIIVFYMLVRFYLEEDTSISHATSEGYSLVSTEDDDEAKVGDDEALKASAAAPAAENMENVVLDVVDDSVADAKPAEPATGAPTLASSGKRVRSAEFLNLHDVPDVPDTKQEVLQRLVVCSAGLIVTFAIWGVMQERMLAQTYDGVYFDSSYGLVFMNRLLGLLLSWSLMVYFQVPWYPTALWEYSIPSMANMLAAYCQYEALRYVSFPVVMLAKAFKMVPVMLVGKVLNNKSYASHEYLSGAVVALGLYLFINASESLTLTTNVFGHPETVSGALCGVVLLLLFLLFDSSTGQWQSRIFDLNPRLSPLQMMLTMNAFSAAFSFVTLVHEEQLTSSLTFVYEHPQMLVHLLFFCAAGTVGQLFIFYTVKHFGAVVFSIIMSLRILVSTALSCWLYEHPITEMGYLGIILVCLATVYRLVKKTQGRQLLRWRDSAAAEQSGIVFKEWHEHLDI